ncbi:MAG TPA: hypothetical protein VEB68_00710 [Croceibacterium sp.]|nr:hypothetical protein [Croceibacterium sp.]
MRKFVKPLIAVLAGIVASWSLQQAGVEPLVAKIIGVAVVVAVLASLWRRSALS